MMGRLSAFNNPCIWQTCVKPKVVRSIYRIPKHLHCRCCTDIGFRTLSSRTKTVPITILLLVRLQQHVRKTLAIGRVSDIHRYSAIVDKLQLLDDVQLREPGIGSQVADFEITRLFGRPSHLADSLNTQNACLGMALMLTKVGMLAY
jgi:hypothetical protein